MKKIFTLLMAIALFTLNSFAQEGAWVKQTLDNKVSVKFPSTPEILNDGAVLRIKTADSCSYTGSFVDFAGMGLDSATLAAMAPTNEFAEQFKSGFSAQIPGLEVSKLDITTWNDFTCYDVEGDIADKKIKMTFKCIFIGSKMFTFAVTLTEKGDAKNIDLFIKSLELVK